MRFAHWDGSGGVSGVRGSLESGALRKCQRQKPDNIRARRGDGVGTEVEQRLSEASM